MGVFRQFPYSNFHEMNMDEIIKIVKNMLEEWAQYYAEWDAWMDQMNDDWSNYQEVMNEAWQNMQDFINNYFDNLDVQNEINNKIASMVNSGQFSDIVAPYIPPRVTEWLSTHITQPVGVVIDTSLSVAGACADAKATGDAMDKLKKYFKNWTHLDDVVIKQGTNLYPLVTEKGNGGYMSQNGIISPIALEGYEFIKIPVTEKTAYFCNEIYRWMFTVDPNGTVVDEVNEPSKAIVTGTNAVECWITYNPSLHPITSISELVSLTANANTVYVLPSNVIPDDYKPGNLFENCGLLGTGIYVGIADNGELDTAENTAFNSYILPVNNSGRYIFTSCRFAVPLAYDRKTALVASPLSNVSEIDTSNYSGIKYIAFSFNTTVFPIDEFTIYKDGNTQNTYPYWTGGQPISALLNGITDIYPVKTPFTSEIANTLEDGNSIVLTNTMCELRKGDRVVLECDITLFSAIEIGLSDSSASITDSHKHNYFEIDSTNISYYISSTTNPYNVPHGLTINNNIQIILELMKNYDLKFTIISDGQLFTTTFANTVKTRQGVWYVISNGSTLTNAKMTWNCADFRKKIWLFGDSYLGYSTSRWLYYLGQFEYDKNCLINAYSGEDGMRDMASFNTLLNYGTPKYAVWCVGMNDGSDIDSEPSATWLSYVTAFIKKCQTENITPILATIPSVPTINNEYKNTWVRESGYRYIDFAKAVGANANGVWFSGMLSDDNVHPTIQGAKALFARALLDLPELMIEF